MASYMITLRTTDEGDEPASSPRYLKLPDKPGQPETELQAAAWQAQIIAQFPKSIVDAMTTPTLTRNGDVIVFVHGFNVDFKSAVATHRRMMAKLNAAGFAGQFISFDWPSKGLTFAYLSDREHARKAANALVTCGIALLRDAQVDGCQINLHVIAHSMGAFVAQQAFTWSYQDVPPDWRLGQLIFVAADVDYTVFSAPNPSAKAFGAHAGRVTAYCDRYDKALAVSNAKRLELAPRMGRVGLPNDAPDTMCEVDCSNLFDAAFPGLRSHLDPVTTHTFYFDQPVFWQDVVLTLAGGLDRDVIPTRSKLSKPDRFALNTAPRTRMDFMSDLARGSQSPSFDPEGVAPDPWPA
jgi:esterase/lipase superfamily enzyme